MAEKKKQHYIPQFYMRLFTDTQKKFAVCNVENREIYPHVPCGSQCYKDYFYGEDKSLENKFSVMENLWKETITKANCMEQLNDEDCYNLKKFIICQRQRTLGDNQFTKQSEVQIAVEVMKTSLAYNGVHYDDTAKEICYKIAEETSNKLGSLNYVDACLKSILDLEVLVINYNTHCELISSDMPVIAINPFCKFSIGYGCMGIILLVPISPHNLLIAYDGKMYQRYVGKQYISLRNETEVLHLNILQLISANKIIFGQETNELQEFNKENWEERRKSRDIAPVSTLGRETDKLIYISPRKVIHNHIFSFGQIKPEFNISPYICREAASRNYDKQWEMKFRNNVQIIPEMVSMRGRNSNTSNTVYTKKEIRNGCKKMLKAAIKYWKCDVVKQNN